MDEKEILVIARRAAAKYRRMWDYDDVLSDAVLGAFEGWRRYDPECTECSQDQHSGITAKRRVIDGLRKRHPDGRRTRRADGETVTIRGESLPAWERQPILADLADLDRAEIAITPDASSGVVDRVVVGQLLATLSPRWRYVLAGRYLYDLDFPSISAQLGVSVRRSYEIHDRALQALRDERLLNGLPARRQDRRVGAAPAPTVPEHCYVRPLDVVLASRQRELVVAMTYSRTNDAVARGMELSPATVHTMVNTVLVKTSCANRVELVARAIAGGIRELSAPETRIVVSGDLRDTIAWYATGRDSKQVAYKLGVSEGAVKSRVKVLAQKFGVDGRLTSIVVEAFRNGILIPRG